MASSFGTMLSATGCEGHPRLNHQARGADEIRASVEDGIHDCSKPNSRNAMITDSR